MDAEQLAVVRRLAAPEDAPLAAVRNRAEQVTTPPPPEVGALLSLLAGARRVRHAVEVGTATFADPRAPRRILGEFEQWCQRHGVESVAELIGGAHD